MEKRNTYTASFKSKVALEALKNSKTLEELSLEFNVHAALISKWKSYLLQESPQVFEGDFLEKKGVYTQIGKIQAQIAFLKENSEQV